MAVTAIVPASGAGRRFIPGSNKPFHILMDRPLIVWTLQRLQAVPEVTEIIPVLKESDMDLGLEIIEKYSLSKVKRIAGGGPERQDSVMNGLLLVSDGTEVVIIHDGVRPLVESSLIRSAIAGLGGFDCVITAVPPKDTIKEAGTDRMVIKTLLRENLWLVQTPQVFRFSSIMASHKRALSEGFYSTDDSALIERYGGKVKVIMGSYRNIKVTTAEDIEVAELFLKGAV